MVAMAAGGTEARWCQGRTRWRLYYPARTAMATRLERARRQGLMSVVGLPNLSKQACARLVVSNLAQLPLCCMCRMPLLPCPATCLVVCPCRTVRREQVRVRHVYPSPALGHASLYVRHARVSWNRWCRWARAAGCLRFPSFGTRGWAGRRGVGAGWAPWRHTRASCSTSTGGQSRAGQAAGGVAA